nr:hypothetical protein [Tanacetum cinerariifolium]
MLENWGTNPSDSSIKFTFRTYSMAMEANGSGCVTKIVLLGLESIPLTSRFIGTRECVVSEKDELPSSVRLEFQAQLDGDQIRDILRQSDCLDRLREIPWLHIETVTPSPTTENIIVRNVGVATTLYSVEEVLQSPCAFQKNMKIACEEPCEVYKQSYNVRPKYALENLPKTTTGLTKEKMSEFKTKKPEESSLNWKPLHNDWDATTSNLLKDDASDDDSILLWTQVAILEAPVRQRYLRLSDGSVLACYVCTPPVFMRKEELMVPHKEEKGESHKKVFRSMIACNRCLSPYPEAHINFTNISATITSQPRKRSTFKLF